MKCIVVLAALLLTFGCISERAAGPTNETEDNITAPEDNITIPDEDITNDTAEPAPPSQPDELRYHAVGFSFLYPADMAVEESKGTSSGIFSGNKELVIGQTGEILIVTYMDTEAVYGANQDDIFKDDPTTASSDFLEADIQDDPAGALLNNAYEIGELSTFAIARDGVVAEVPFKIRFGDSNKSYSGYAMDVYVPETSLHVKMRVVALDPVRSESIRDSFLDSFWLE